MRNEGWIVACDASPERLKLVQENCERLGVTCVKPACLTASRSESGLSYTSSFEPTAVNLPASYDRILVDAPCSNTGVMRRRVELRWRVRPEEIQRLRTLQLELLSRAARLLKTGGTLVYSTCSLEPEENQEIVEEFLTEQGGFHLEEQRELLPFLDEADGAFVAVLKSRNALAVSG
jgi:16S rRNA (cytosine967-C5)-methyltransferase